MFATTRLEYNQPLSHDRQRLQRKNFQLKKKKKKNLIYIIYLRNIIFINI